MPPPSVRSRAPAGPERSLAHAPNAAPRSFTHRRACAGEGSLGLSADRSSLTVAARPPKALTLRLHCNRIPPADSPRDSAWTAQVSAGIDARRRCRRARGEEERLGPRVADRAVGLRGVVRGGGLAVELWTVHVL